jgi:hypothetical protein
MSPKQAKPERWRLLADPKMQGMLCFRVVVYWLLCQAIMAGTIALFAFFGNGSDSGATGGFVFSALIASALFLPIVVVDMLFVSNRLAGPVINFRQGMNQILDCDQIEELSFRPGDYYQDLGESFNELRKRINGEHGEVVGRRGHQNEVVNSSSVSECHHV